MSDTISFSHSLMSNMDCMKKVEFMLSKTAQVPSAAPMFGIRMHKHCETYLSGGYPTFADDRESETFEKIIDYLDQIKDDLIEAEIKLRRSEDDFNSVGVFDALTLTQDGKYILHDWKFVGKPWDQKRFEDYRFKQALLYLWIAAEHYDPQQIKSLVYIVVPEVGRLQLFHVEYNNEEIENALRRYKSMLRQIEHAQQMGEFSVNNGPHCNWCGWRNICPDKWVRRSNVKEVK